ncbi:MAG TPA: hypothetical protein VMY98_04420 [Anaerolineae bacterium]|nr:hypothetical protein [Anaerolineae bacterium]
MKPLMPVLLVALVIGLAVAAVGCDRSRRTPTPTPTVPVGVPDEVLSARDAALLYVRQAYPDRAPPQGLTWAERKSSQQGLVGASSYEFASGAWLVTVQVPVVSPDAVVYDVGLGNDETGFRWTGRLNASDGVLESNLDVAAEVLAVRDAILLHAAENYSHRAPAKDLIWVGARTTPEGSMGHESCQFASGAWTMTVEYDLVPLVRRIYHIELSDSSSGFVWRGQIDVDWIVMEHR